MTEMSEELLAQIWKDAETCRKEILRKSGKHKSEAEEEPVFEFCNTEDNEEDDWALLHTVEDQCEEIQNLEARFTMKQYQPSVTDLARYPKSTTCTFIGSFTNLPFWKMSALQRTQMKLNRDNKESYLKDIEKNLRTRMNTYPSIQEGQIETAVGILHEAWAALHPKRKLIHEKLCSFVIYFTMKRFHNPSVGEVAGCLGITRVRAQKGIKELRIALANHPNFKWLSDADYGKTNLYRKGLEQDVIVLVREKAETFQVDLRDDKALSQMINMCQEKVSKNT